jgi:DNA repair protein RadC
MIFTETRKRSIKDWAASDRPREKLITNRAKSLSHSELLAILIRNGNTENSALELARQVLNASQNNLQELSKWTIKDLIRVKGIGTAKAATIVAAFELGRRRHSELSLERRYIRNSRESADYIRPLLIDYRHEVFGVLFLGQAGWIRTFEILSEGGITSTTVDIRLIFKRTLEEGAVSIVIFHNHPSGSLRPSKADEQLTSKLAQASKIMDIKLLDHVIVGDNGYFSFADEGLLD